MSNFQSYQSYQAAPDAPDAEASGVRIHVGTGTQAATVVDGVMTDTFRGHEKGHSGELNPHHGEDSVLATAQHPKGLPVYQIEDSTLITVNGVQAPASFWAKEGVLTKAADGSYAEATGQPPAPQEAQGEDVFPLHPDNISTIDAAIGGIDGSHATALAAAYIGAATGRLVPDALARKFGELTGLQGEEALQRIGVVQGIFEGEAAHHLEKRLGVAQGDQEAFFQWARENRRDALGDAIGRQIHGRDLSGYRRLAQEWMNTTPPSAEALKAAGIPVRRSHHKAGDVEVFIPGAGNGWMSVGAAARAGLL